MKNMTFKKITSQRLFLPIFCLALVLLVNIITTPNFFAIEIRDGVLYGYIIDIINRASELVILAVGMTLVVSSSAGTDISVGAIMAVSAAVCCNISDRRGACGNGLCKSSDPRLSGGFVSRCGNRLL